jgi:hypothetical protein
MTETEMLERMVAPGTRRAGKYRSGVIQILVTSSCDKSCFSCTQASNIRREPWFMTPEQFEQAVRSLGFTADGEPEREERNVYYGVVGLFGGNPAISPHFADYCGILHKLVPFNQRGIWCNNPLTLEKAQMMRATFDPSVSNLNVHLDKEAYYLFKKGWPESNVVGLDVDSRHSPPFVAMKDVLKVKCDCCVPDPVGTFVVGIPMELCRSDCPKCHGHGEYPDDSRIRELVSNCDINQHWSALIGVFRGQLRAWFCEVAGAQAILHQHEPDYPDTGLDPSLEWEVEEHRGGGYKKWWQLGMLHYKDQVRKHCWDCGVPLRGHGQLSQGEGFEQTSATHEAVYRPKTKDRQVELVTNLVQLDVGKIQTVTKYLQNSKV